MAARPSSVWWDDGPFSALTPRAPLEGNVRARTVIVGCGVAGASLADALTTRGDDVVLLEARSPGVGATGRNAGFLLAESECFALTADEHGAPAAKALRAHGIRTRELVRDIAADGCDLTCPGSVRLATDPGEARAFTQCATAGLDGVRLLPPSEVAEAPQDGSVLSALVDDGDGTVHPLRLLAHMLERAERGGVRRFDGSPVKGIDTQAGSALVRTAAGTVTADRVVVSNGPSARLLLGTRAAPIRPVRAQALVAEVTPTPTWSRPVYATRGGDYWRLLPDGRVLLGGMRRVDRRAENTRDDSPTAPVQNALDALLVRLAPPDARIDVTHRWAGTMAFTRDGLPWVGAIDERTHVLAGFVGHGMGWAASMAESLARQFHGDDGGLPLRAFRPDR